MSMGGWDEIGSKMKQEKLKRRSFDGDSGTGESFDDDMRWKERGDKR